MFRLRIVPVSLIFFGLLACDSGAGADKNAKNSSKQGVAPPQAKQPEPAPAQPEIKPQPPVEPAPVEPVAVEPAPVEPPPVEPPPVEPSPSRRRA
jgi:hypothetical protein